MLYASDLFRSMGEDYAGLEDNPDDLPDLVAEILAHAVEQRQHRHLSLGYQTRKAPLSRVRGRIDVLYHRASSAARSWFGRLQIRRTNN
jgi:5-methylcytosine-specific restriction enzyme subunit McrC